MVVKQKAKTEQSGLERADLKPCKLLYSLSPWFKPRLGRTEKLTVALLIVDIGSPYR